MTEAHDDTVVGLCGDGGLAGERFALDDQGVITRGGEWLRDIPENVFSVMMDFARFAVKQFRSANDFAAEGGPDRLMAEADAKNRKSARESLN